jgi:hypothetical protein
MTRPNIASLRRLGCAVLVVGSLLTAASATADSGGSPGSPVVHIRSLHVDSCCHQATARFSGTGGTPPLRYWCLVDDGAGHYCHSPLTLRHLRRGAHKLMIEAEDSTGLISTFWAIRRFRVK